MMIPETLLVLVLGIAIGIALSASFRKAASVSRRKRRSRPLVLKRFDPACSAEVSRWEQK